jgi:hypothetical protein
VCVALHIRPMSSGERQDGSEPLVIVAPSGTEVRGAAARGPCMLGQPFAQ